VTARFAPSWRDRRLTRLLLDERFQVASLLLLALLVRLAFHFRTPAFVAKDSQSYFLPGWSIAHGVPFDLGQRRTPGYPLFIAGSILLFGQELRALALAQHLLGVGTVGATYLLGRLTFGRPAGLLAGLLVAISGPLLLYERYLLSEALFGFILTATVLAGVAAIVRSSWQRWLLAGLLLGCAVLVRPVAQMLIPLLALAALATHWRAWRSCLVALAALALGLTAIQLPWMVRNALEKGNFGASTFGRTLIARTAYYDRGFVFEPTGSAADDPLLRRANEIVQQGARRQDSDGTIAGRLRAELNLDPVQVNRVMRDIALAAILRNPLHYGQGTLEYARWLFAGLEERPRDHWDEYKDVNRWDARIWPLVGPPTEFELRERGESNQIVYFYQPAHHAPLLAALFLLGTVLALLEARYRPALLASATVVLVLLSSAALNGPVERYRYPVDPLISLLAAGGLCGGLALLFDLRRRLRAAPPGARPVALTASPRDQAAAAAPPAEPGRGPLSASGAGEPVHES
jgi:hypothetical protein